MEGITVIIPTYNRPDILAGAIARIGSNLHYHLGFQYTFLIGNDGEPGLDKYLRDIFGSDAIKVLEGPRRGLGANLNMLINACDTDLILQMDDDHWLEKELDINRYVSDMRNPDLNMGWVRLFLGEEHDVYNFDTYYKFKAATHGPYWFLDPDSPTLYMASNRPHLKKVSMHEKYFGWYEEDVKLGETETVFCHQYKTLKNHQKFHESPWISIPMFGLQIDQWKHVGDSWQKRGK